jgi:hypothetical protein
MFTLRSVLLAAGLGLLAACVGTNAITNLSGAPLGAAARPGAARTDLATASATETATSPAAAEESESGDDLICERVQETGSHFRTRRCYTRAEREQARRESQELLREAGSQRGVEGEGRN